MTMPKVAYFVIEQTENHQFRATSEAEYVEVFSDGTGFYSNLVAYPNVLPGAVPVIKFPTDKKPLIPEDTNEDHWYPVDANGQRYWAYLFKNHDRNRYESKAFNSSGEMNISDGQQYLTLKIDTCLFSSQDLNEAVDDFKCELLNIILNDSQIFVRANRQDFSPLLSDLAVESIRQLILTLETITRNPKCRLTQNTQLTPTNKARPTAKGVRQFIVNSSIKQVEARVSKVDYDTGENRYVFNTAKELHQFVLMVDTLQQQWLNTTQVDLNWTDGLSLHNELEEQKQFEKQYWAHHQQISEQIKNQNISALLARIDTVLRKFRSYGISSAPSSFNPMVFVQNPAYARFKKARTLFIEERLFSELGMISRLGAQLSKLSIMNLPDFYERWCLVKLIDILVNHFHYEVDGAKWRKKFVAICLLNRRGIMIPMKRSFGEYYEHLQLSYQEEFEIDGKKIRPDFVIRTKEGTWIADAKFRTHSTDQQLMDLCKELANTKKYHLNNQVSVFLFHCANYAGDDSSIRYINYWRRFCNYGANGDNNKIGHILLSPQACVKKQSLNNLIRWLLMILQESNQPFCPNCGEPLLDSKNLKIGTQYKCPNCGFGSLRVQCASCKKVFWKNKLYWSYNLYDRFQRTILCPKCLSESNPFKRKRDALDLHLSNPARYTIDGEDMIW